MRPSGFSSRRRPEASGFTLIEVVIALAILGLSLMAIFDLEGGAISMHGYAKRLSVGTLLAREKMTDLTQKLYDEGFSADDEMQEGDFSEEGWPSYSWKAKILVPKTDGVPPEQLISALFGIPVSQGGGFSALFGGGKGGDAKGGGLAALLGGDKSGAGGDADSSQPQQGASPMEGALAGMAATQLQRLLQQISQGVREVRLTVSWKHGSKTESFDVVTHVVSLGPGSDRNGFVPGGATGTTGATGTANGASSPASALQQLQQLQQRGAR